MRVGIDLGGTKIEAIAMDDNNDILRRERTETPQNSYEAILGAIKALVSSLEESTDAARAIGIGAPGSISPLGNIMQNCNTTCLNGKNLASDLQNTLGKPVRLANDADCFALSEAKDGAGKGFDTVFGVILGTGVGGGFVAHGQLLTGPNALTGEWGHNPLYQPGPVRTCFCGRVNCVETWISGPAVAREYNKQNNSNLSAQEIAVSDEPEAIAAVDRFLERLSAALGAIINSFDPHCIVFGGGLSNIDRIYNELPDLTTNHILPSKCRTTFAKAKFGDSSGVRGAAWLWP